MVTGRLRHRQEDISRGRKFLLTVISKGYRMMWFIGVVLGIWLPQMKMRMAMPITPQEFSSDAGRMAGSLLQMSSTVRLRRAMWRALS